MCVGGVKSRGWRGARYAPHPPRTRPPTPSHTPTPTQHPSARSLERLLVLCQLPLTHTYPPNPLNEPTERTHSLERLLVLCQLAGEEDLVLSHARELLKAAWGHTMRACVGIVCVGGWSVAPVCVRKPPPPPPPPMRVPDDAVTIEIVQPHDAINVLIGQPVLGGATGAGGGKRRGCKRRGGPAARTPADPPTHPL